MKKRGIVFKNSLLFLYHDNCIVCWIFVSQVCNSTEFVNLPSKDLETLSVFALQQRPMSGHSAGKYLWLNQLVRVGAFLCGQSFPSTHPDPSSCCMCLQFTVNEVQWWYTWNPMYSAKAKAIQWNVLKVKTFSQSYFAFLYIFVMGKVISCLKSTHYFGTEVLTLSRFHCIWNTVSW